MEARQFPSWSKNLSLSSPVAKKLVTLHDTILGISFPPPPLLPASNDMSTEKSGIQQKEEDGGKSRYALLWGANWLIKLPLSLSTTGGHSKTSRKRRRPQQDQVDVQASMEESLTNSSSKLVTHYRPILYVDFLDDGELVVVERPLVDVLRTLPPAYFKHRYGSS